VGIFHGKDEEQKLLLYGEADLPNESPEKIILGELKEV